MKAPRSPGRARAAVARKKWTCSPARRLASRPWARAASASHSFQPGRDLVVAHVGGVAEDRACRRRPGRDLRRAVVAGDHPRAPGEARGGEVAAAGRRGERVELDRHQPGRAEAAAGRDGEAARARAGVDDPCGRALAGRPGDHGLDDRRRRVGGAVGAPQLGRAQAAEGLAEGVAAAAIARAQGRDQRRRRARRVQVAGQGGLGGRPPRDVARAEREGGSEEGRLRGERRPRRARWAARGRVYGGRRTRPGAPAA